MALQAHIGAGWTIRPHSRADREAIAYVHHACLSDFPWLLTARHDPDALEYALRYTTAMVAEEPSAGVIGFIILNTENAFVSHLFVLPDWRLCGVGSGLLDVARVLTTKPLRQELDARNHQGRSALSAMGWTEIMAPPGTPNWQVRLVAP
ncbi:MAG: hypothetical protein CMK09_08165 [Ponticaulis sp.]|nr:hypothetical protein [Ponticaulis sp.]